MSIETNLNVAPYFDDYSKDKGYYKILFRPGVSVQARELTQIQDILQNQVESFGDHVFKSGTIVSGVNFQFYPSYNYVKILDSQVDGQPAAPSAYQNLYAKNSTNLEAKIINYKAGYQSTDPDINYLYLKYINAGDSGVESTFANSDVLTIYNKTYELYDFNVVNGGTGFSNSDSVEIVSTLLVNNQVMGVGNITQTNGSNTANVYVIESNTSFNITVDGVEYSSADGYAILKIKPNDADLSNTSMTSERWNIQSSSFITQGANNSYVVAKIGAGATAELTTDSSGVITDVSLTSAGYGYQFAPYVTIRTADGSLNNLEITPQMYKAQVTIADSTFTGGGANPVGSAYAFGVTEGTIYQKGYFLKVDSQTIVVNAYSSNVNDVSVGFVTTEKLVNNNVDSTLLDNATGSYNFAAPGAHRLKLTPTLSVIGQSNVASNNSFFTLVDFRDGQPYKQNKNTSYNVLLKEFEKRTDDTNGNFVVDPFEISTKDKTTWSNTEVNVVVDPGTAYINGTRVETQKNTFVPISRSVATRTLEGQYVSLNYGSYIKVNNYAGFFNTQTAATVDLYDTAKSFYSSVLTTITPAGKKLGTARVRSVVLDSGVPGTTGAVYRIYLFDIRMNSGKTFKNVKSIYYDGPGATDLGIADAIQELDASSDKQVTLLKDSSQSSLVYETGMKGVNDLQNVSYTYRTSNSTANVSTLGIVTLTIGDLFPFGLNATLSGAQRKQLVVTALANVTSTNVSSSATATLNQAVITGSSFTSYFRTGDQVYLENSSDATANMYATISSVANSAYLTIDRVWPYSSNDSINVARHIPAYYPIVLDDERVTANTDSLGQTLTINLGGGSNTITLSSLVPVTIIYDAKKTDTPIEKTVTRNALVKISAAGNEATTSGPWCLGVPDVFRLNAVYVANTSAVNTNSQNITSSFFVSTGQNNDYYGLSYLHRQPNGRQLAPDEYLLVSFDCFTLASPTSAGYYSINSYKLTQNNTPRSSLSNNYINILEIPTYKAANGKVMSLENCVDFRPRVSNTANITSTLASATVDPSSTISFGSFSKNFPYPDSNFEYEYSYYLQRKDRVVIDLNGNISVVKGTPATTPVPPPEFNDQITLGIVNVPPYPSLPQVLDKNQVEFLTTRISTDTTPTTKRIDYQITETIGSKQYRELPKRYTMADIGRLERRIQNLEYYSSLNLLEKKTVDLAIPSSINPSLNRFKHGYFVDNFTDYLQFDATSAESTAVIDQAKGYLEPNAKTLNLQAKFNYSNTTTYNSLQSEDELTEPGHGKWGESVLMLPTNGTYDLVNQGRFTSAINGVGGDVQFGGDLTVKPSSLKVTFKAQVKVLDTYDYAVDAGDDVSPGNTVINSTDPVYNLSSNKTTVVEGSSANIVFETINVANGTSFPYTITGVSANDVNVALTGTLTVLGNTNYAVASLPFSSNADAVSESNETMVFTVNTAGANTTAVSIVIQDDGLNPVGSLTANADFVVEGDAVLFTLSTTNIANGTVIPYALNGLGLTTSDIDVPLTGNLTVNSSGGASLTVTTRADFVTEGMSNTAASGREPMTLSLGYPLNNTRTVYITDVRKPVFSFTSNTYIVNEGSAIKCTIETDHASYATANVPYVITGVVPGDIDQPLTGTLTLSGGSANIVITTNTTMITSGSPTMVVTANLQTHNVNSIPLNINIVDQTPEHCALTSNASSVDEGDAVKFTLQANGFNGNVFNYTITGVSATDIDTALTGTLTVAANAANLVITANTDGTAEETEYLTLTVATTLGNVSHAVAINSYDSVPTPTYALSVDKNNVDEGGTATFTLNTKGVGNATYSYIITPVGTSKIYANDFTSGVEGTITTTGNVYSAVGTVSITTANNMDFNSETFRFSVANGVNIYKDVVINATKIPVPTLTVNKTTIALDSASAAQRQLTLTLTCPGVANGTNTTYLNSYHTGGNKNNLSGNGYSGTMTFTNGVATKILQYVSDGDSDYEYDEWKVMLPSPYTAPDGSDYLISPRILQMDGTKTFTTSIDKTTLPAGNTATIKMSVAATTWPFTFNYAISGATSAELSGLPLTGTITTAANTTSKNSEAYLSIAANSTYASAGKSVTVAIGSTVPGNMNPDATSQIFVLAPDTTTPGYGAGLSLETVQVGNIIVPSYDYYYMPKVVTANVKTGTKLYAKVYVTRAGTKISGPTISTITIGTTYTMQSTSILSTTNWSSSSTPNQGTTTPIKYNGSTGAVIAVSTPITGVKVGDTFVCEIYTTSAATGTPVASTSALVPAGFQAAVSGAVKIGY